MRFSKHATPAVVYSLTHPRLVPRLVLSRLAGRLVPISACSYMPYSLYRPVGSCSSGLVRPASSPGVAHDIASPSPSPASSYISIISSYSCIFVSFIYIAYIIFIIYIHRRDMMSRTPIHKQAPSRPASRPVRLESNKRHEARAIANEEQEAGDDEPSRDTARLNAPQP